MARLKEELLNGVTEPTPTPPPPAPISETAPPVAENWRAAGEALPQPAAPKPTPAPASESWRATGDEPPATGYVASTIPDITGGQNLTRNPSASQSNAIQAFMSLLAGYGIKDEPGQTDLVKTITDYTVNGYTGDEMQLMMQNPSGTDALAKAFQARFPANKLRAEKGLAPMSIDQYISYENTYRENLKEYQMESIASKDNITNFLVNNISPDAVSKVAAISYNVVNNADPNVLADLKKWYPTISIGDVAALLMGGETVTSLNRKVQEAEIGAAAQLQNLPTSYGADVSLGAANLAKAGVTTDLALRGYSEIASKLPGFQQLSERYGKQTGLMYDQRTAEQSTLLNQAQAKRTEDILNEYEANVWRAKYGVSPDAGTLQRNGGQQGMQY